MNKIHNLRMPNGETIKAALIRSTSDSDDGGMTVTQEELYYGQNRLFLYITECEYIPAEDGWDEKPIKEPKVEILSDYCTIPDLDELLSKETEKMSKYLASIVRSHDLNTMAVDCLTVAELILHDVEHMIFEGEIENEFNLELTEAAVFYILTSKWSDIYRVCKETTKDFLINDARQAAYEHLPENACKIPEEKPGDAVKAESIKESEVEKASDSDIDKEYTTFGFKSQKEFDEYMDEAQRAADDADRSLADELEDMDRIKKKFMLGRRYSLYAGGTYQILRMLIEDVVIVLNKKSKKEKYWDDAVKVILGEPTWACVCDIVKNDFPSLYSDLTERVRR